VIESFRLPQLGRRSYFSIAQAGVLPGRCAQSGRAVKCDLQRPNQLHQPAGVAASAGRAETQSRLAAAVHGALEYRGHTAWDPARSSLPLLERPSHAETHDVIAVVGGIAFSGGRCNFEVPYR
jgi:hypothetical protein